MKYNLLFQQICIVRSVHRSPAFKSLSLIIVLLFFNITTLVARSGSLLPVYSIFQPSDVPVNTLANDAAAVEVGTKFRSSQTGIVLGVRYYKGAGTTGVHKGHLWTSAGLLLAEATFTSETASGWQEVLFEKPVPVQPNVTYIISYHSASGDYAYTSNYFVGAVTNGPLKALADGEDGNNGLYSYSPTAISPTSSYNSSCYFVDVVFSPGDAGGVFDGEANYIPKFTSPLSLGNSSLFDNGTSVGIGTTSIGDVNYRLFVESGIKTRKVTVDQASWPDYVFNQNYNLLSLSGLREFIRRNHHLPDVPSEREVQEKGLNLGDNQALLLKKIEELTLYILQLDEKIEALKAENEKLRIKKDQ